MAIELNCSEFTQSKHKLSPAAKRVLASATVRALLLSSIEQGESNEYCIVLNRGDFAHSFPSLTNRRLKELLDQLIRSTFSEPRLGYSEKPIIVEGHVLSKKGSSTFQLQLVLSADYRGCVLKLGCLPT